MATNYPSSLDSGTQQPSPSSTTDLDATGYEHDVVHTNHSGAIIALETKLGTGDSNAVADAVLMGTGSGTSAWDTSPTFKGAVTVGVDDTGHDVKFFGATSGKYMEWDESEDELVISGGLKLDSVGITTIQTGSESFVDNDTSVMTSAAVQDKILSYGYTTDVGDITGVTAGTNLSGGGSSGAVTINMSDPITLNEGIIKHLRSSDSTLYLGNSSGWELRLNSSQLTPYVNAGLGLGNASYWFAGLYSSTWVRMSGTTGIYFQSYGGGLHMEDSTWIRTYGSGKGLLSEGGMAGALSGTSSLSGYQYVVRSTAYTSFAYYTSSRETKDQIETFADSGAIIDALRPVTFIEKSRPDTGTNSDHIETEVEKALREADLNYGFVAEEIAENPLTEKLGQYDAEFDAVGWKWPDLITVLTAEVKSLRQRVSTLEG